MAEPRNSDRQRENEMLRPREGRTPRPATEPRGVEPSTRTDKTLADPVTGKPNRSQAGGDGV